MAIIYYGGDIVQVGAYSPSRSLGFVPAEFSDPSYLGLVTAGVQSQGYVFR